MSSGWIGVDLDGTLAHYDGWVDELHIGKPIPQMVERVKEWRRQDIPVKIFTARVTEVKRFDGSPEDISDIYRAIEKWCLEHIGEKLPITNVKDYGCLEIWDDRAVGIACNTGEIRTHERSREGWKTK